jgi:hypothetical protein
LDPALEMAQSIGFPSDLRRQSRIPDELAEGILEFA